MPTEQEFEEAKVRLFVAADDAEGLLTPTRTANDRGALTGGRLTADVDSFVEASGGRLSVAADELRELARECRRRAEECRQAAAARDAFLAATADYEQSVAEHRESTTAYADDPSLPEPGQPPTAPAPPPDPPPYVEI